MYSYLVLYTRHSIKSFWELILSSTPPIEINICRSFLVRCVCGSVTVNKEMLMCTVLYDIMVGIRPLPPPLVAPSDTRDLGQSDSSCSNPGKSSTQCNLKRSSVQGTEILHLLFWVIQDLLIRLLIYVILYISWILTQTMHHLQVFNTE